MVSVKVIGIDDFNDESITFLCEDNAATTQIVPLEKIEKSVDEILDLLPFEATIVVNGVTVDSFTCYEKTSWMI